MNNDIVLINLDRPRQLKFTHSALKRLVADTGDSVDDIGRKFNPANFELIETMVFYGLLKDAKDNSEVLSADKVVDLLDEAPSFAHVVEKLTDAWFVAMGTNRDEAIAQEGNQEQPVESKLPAERNSTGKKVKG